MSLRVPPKTNFLSSRAERVSNLLGPFTSQWPCLTPGLLLSAGCRDFRGARHPGAPFLPRRGRGGARRKRTPGRGHPLGRPWDRGWCATLHGVPASPGPGLPLVEPVLTPCPLPSPQSPRLFGMGSSTWSSHAGPPHGIQCRRRTLTSSEAAPPPGVGRQV